MSTRILATVALATFVAAPALAEVRAYRGPHPVDLDGRWHLEDAVHVHDELPPGAEPFGDVDGVRVFLADPLAWGWTGEVWTYRGAHPLPGGLSAYCGISGDHRHPFAPEGGSYRRAGGGEYAFIGALRGGVPMVRPARSAPRHPIVTVDSSPLVAAPFWLSGCLHTTVVGPDGRLESLPLAGCIPIVERSFSRERAPPPSPERVPTYFDGNYTSARSRPGVVGQRGDATRQRPP